MLAPERYVEVVRAAVDDIAADAEGNLDAPVEHCPGFDVAQLLVHTGGFCRVIGERVRTGTNVDTAGAWRTPPPDEIADPVGWHRRCGAVLLAALAESDPDAPAETWAGRRTKRFQFRRAAHELVVHRFDAEHARRGGSNRVIPADVAADGVDEFLGEFGPRVAERFGGTGETFLFTCADSPYVAHVTLKDKRLDLVRERLPARVVVTAPAADLLLFVWGRRPASDVDADGERSLLSEWRQRVRI